MSKSAIPYAGEGLADLIGIVPSQLGKVEKTAYLFDLKDFLNPWPSLGAGDLSFMSIIGKSTLYN